jgi:N-acetylmuramoyl-L-alanine amidase
MNLTCAKTKIASIMFAVLFASGLFVTSGYAAGQLSSSVYAVERDKGMLTGVKPGTSAEALIGNMEGDFSRMALKDAGGNVVASGPTGTGMSLELMEDSAVVDTLTVVVMGDINGDSVVSVADYTLERLYLLGMKTLEGACLCAGDASGDGKITIGDYTRLRLNILGLGELGAGSLPLEGCLIGLDPGHQAHANSDLEPAAPGSSEMIRKVSSGTQGRFTRVPEYVVNLQVGLKLKAKLEELGATVIMTRTTNDVDISNAERAQMMNKAGVNCWLRIHVNGNDNPAVNGVSILAPAKGTMNTKDINVQLSSVKLAQTLLETVISSTGAKNNGVPLRSDQTGFNWSSVPVCNIEMGYMTNEREDRLIVTDEYQNKVVDGLVQGFLNYFNKV